MKTKKLICPNCGDDRYVEEYDCLNYDKGEKSVTFWHTGQCTKCEHEFDWDEVFYFDHYEID